MTPTLCGVGIHSLFTGNVQSAGKEQSGKYKGESREPRNAWDCPYSLALLGHPGRVNGLVGDMLPFMFFNQRWFPHFIDLLWI